MKKSYNELKTLINKLGYENPEVVKYARDLEEQERKDKTFVRSTMSGLHPQVRGLRGHQLRDLPRLRHGAGTHLSPLNKRKGAPL